MGSDGSLVFIQLTSQASSGLVSIAIPDIYMKQPYFVTNKKGKQVKKQRYVKIATVVAMRLKEDEDPTEEKSTEKEQPPATYKGANLLISNRFDNPKEVLENRSLFSNS